MIPGSEVHLGASSTCGLHSVSIFVEVVCAQTIEPTYKPPKVTLIMFPPSLHPPDVREQSLINLIAAIPRERFVSLNVNHDEKLSEGALSMMANVKKWLIHSELSERLLQPRPDGPLVNTQLLPSLRELEVLIDVYPKDGDWGHLMTNLAHQTSGGQIISLEMNAVPPYMPPEVADKITNMVQEFDYYEDTGGNGGSHEDE